ncbi:MAG: T9SS type A sorting domain-containing protein [Fluviicola sp.]
MKTIITLGMFFPLFSFGQVSYDVTVTRLRAYADDCDGGAITFCANAPQDPVYNIWVSDQEANEQTYCWIFEDDNDAAYAVWTDIQDVQIASEANVNTTNLTFEMSGFETDNLNPNCTSALGDDAVIDREFVQEITLSTLTEGVVNTVIIDLQDTYYAELEIIWTDLTASNNELAAPALTLAPNPTNGSFTVATTGVTGERTIEIRDMTGRTIQTIVNSQDVTEVNLNNMESGNYFVYVHSENGTAIEKLVVK